LPSSRLGWLPSDHITKIAIALNIEKLGSPKHIPFFNRAKRLLRLRNRINNICITFAQYVNSISIWINRRPIFLVL